jgi:aspartyl-tRNA synthetase
VHKRRDHGGLIFIDLRDKTGITQVVFDPVISPESHAMAESIRNEWVIEIEGTVRARADGMQNPNLKTGEIEVEGHQVTLLSKAKTPLSLLTRRTSRFKKRRGFNTVTLILDGARFLKTLRCVIKL